MAHTHDIGVAWVPEGTFKLASMTLEAGVSRPVTEAYPAAPRDYTPTTKGHVDCRVTDCLFCGACARQCPTSSIRVDRAEGTWELDSLSCIQCRVCTTVCPKGCLAMLTDYPAPTGSRRDAYLTHEELSDEQRAARARERAAKVAAAKAAKEAKVAAAREARAVEEAARTAGDVGQAVVDPKDGGAPGRDGAER